MSDCTLVTLVSFTGKQLWTAKYALYVLHFALGSNYAVDNMVHVDVSLFDALPPAAELAAEDEICPTVCELLQYIG